MQWNCLSFINTEEQPPNRKVITLNTLMYRPIMLLVYDEIIGQNLVRDIRNQAQIYFFLAKGHRNIPNYSMYF